MLTGVIQCLWGHNSVNSSSITVNDSLDCLHRPYGHDAKIYTPEYIYDVLAEILRNFEEISGELFATRFPCAMSLALNTGGMGVASRKGGQHP